jgi:hypothetical protein
MSEAISENIVNDEDAKKFLNALTQQRTIKILIYTDVKIVDSEDGFGITTLRRLLQEHQPTSASISVELISRVRDGSQADLSKLLGNDTYSQVWFFGYQQLTKDEQDKPENPTKFSKKELEDLVIWMNKGGVLIAGDHSEEDPRLNPPERNNHENYLALGRALGHQVPRAGQLRTWKGPPTLELNDSHNTQVLLCAEDDFASDIFERDHRPQLLILNTFDGTTGEPLPNGRPHQIFEGMKDGKRCWIRLFPDHTHDGEVIIPSGKELKKWLKVNGVEPYPASCGIDKRHGARYIQLALYNGDQAGVGRIAADSTWHHYLNLNLRGFRDSTADPSVLNLIGQFYSNLAVWLSPFQTRLRMAFFTFHKLARHPRVLEEISGQVLNIGKVAYNILVDEKATPCEIHELLQAAVPAALRKKYPTLYFPTSSLTISPLASQQLLLGSIVVKWHQKISGINDDSTLDYEAKMARAEEIINEAYGDARVTHENQLSEIFKQTQRFAVVAKRLPK